MGYDVVIITKDDEHTVAHISYNFRIALQYIFDDCTFKEMEGMTCGRLHITIARAYLSTIDEVGLVEDIIDLDASMIEKENKQVEQLQGFLKAFLKGVLDYPKGVIHIC